MSNPIPRNKQEAERRLRALKEEYVKVRKTDSKRASAVAKEIYALQEWLVAQK